MGLEERERDRLGERGTGKERQIEAGLEERDICMLGEMGRELSRQWQGSEEDWLGKRDRER